MVAGGVGEDHLQSAQKLLGHRGHLQAWPCAFGLITCLQDVWVPYLTDYALWQHPKAPPLFFHIFIALPSSCGLCSLVSAASWFCFILYIFRFLFPLIPFAVLFGSLTCPSPWTNAAIRIILRIMNAPLYLPVFCSLHLTVLHNGEDICSHSSALSLFLDDSNHI